MRPGLIFLAFGICLAVGTILPKEKPAAKPSTTSTAAIERAYAAPCISTRNWQTQKTDCMTLREREAMYEAGQHKMDARICSNPMTKPHYVGQANADQWTCIKR